MDECACDASVPHDCQQSLEEREDRRYLELAHSKLLSPEHIYSTVRKTDG